MKRAVLIGIWAVVGVSAGCTLPDPVSFGDPCPGITANDIQWGSQDDCRIAEREGDEGACAREAEKTIHIQTGYCPYKFACQSIKGVNQCVHKCQNEHEVLCEGECINPSKDLQYCGAKGTCMGSDPENEKDYRGDDCSAKSEDEVWACKNSRCEKTPCVLGQHLKEKDGSEAICVPDNNYACGSEDKSCKDDEVCYLGVCRQVCQNQDHIICRVEGVGNQCIDPQTNPKFCGARGKCNAEDREDEHYKGDDCGTGDCVRGSCWHQGCENEYECSKSGQCLTKDPTGCGKTCQVCTSVLNAQEATCDEVGVCHVVTCLAKSHFVSDTEACVPNTTHACGSVDTADVVDCTALPHASAVQCIYGECIVEACEADHHLHENTCEVDSDENCGSHGHKCQVPNGTSQCQNGACVTMGCDEGFHQEDNYCTGDNLNNCGGKDCTAEPGWLSGLCDETVCKATYCQTGYYLDDSTCEPNDENNCGTKGESCVVVNGKSECDTSTGQCGTAICDADYHVSADGKTCQEDTDKACGASRQNCNDMGPQYSGGKCEGGTCVPTGCAPYFDLVNNQACVESCYIVFRNEKAYCCHNDKTQSECYRSGDCMRCEHYGDIGGSEMNFPYKSCWPNACDNANLYCNENMSLDDETICLSLQETCDKYIVESDCFVSGEHLLGAF